MNTAPMTATDNKIVIFMTDQKNNKLINQFVSMVESKEGYEYEFITSAEEVLQYLNMIPQALLIFEILDRDSLTQVMSILKSAEKLIKAKHVKVAGYNHLKSDTIEKALKRLGCNDFLTEDIKAKTLSFKIDFWFKTLKPKVMKSAADENKTVVSKNKNIHSGNKAETTSDKKTGVHVVPALDLENDIWILKQKNDCKNVLRRWLIKLMGPSTQLAKWNQVTVDSSDGQKHLWRFDFIPKAKSKFTTDDGFWFYDGPKPEFDWKENVWIFTGENPSLFYVLEEQVDYRFKTEDKAILICDNSVFAKSKQELIIESFNREYEFKNEEEIAKDTEEAFNADPSKADESSAHRNGDVSINGKMQGKGSTDKQTDDQLEGDGSSADQIDGHMSGKNGKAASINGNMAGKVGPNGEIADGNDPFEGVIDKLDSFYRGGDVAKQKTNPAHDETAKSSFNENLGGALSGKMNGDKSNQEDAKRGNFSSDELEKYLGGKTSGEEKMGPNKGETQQSADKIEGHLKNKKYNEDEDKDVESVNYGQKKEKKNNDNNPDNILAFDKTKQKTNQGSNGLSDNFAQVYSDNDSPERDYDENGPYSKKQKKQATYERDNVIEDENLDPLNQLDYERLTASGEVRVILENKAGESVIKTMATFQDLFESDLVVSVKNLSPAEGDSFKVYILLKYLNEKVSLNINTIVTEVELDETENIITLDLQDYPKEKLSHFMDVYMQRQANIVDFLQKVKGL